MISAAQVTRARELLAWSIVDLERWSDVGRIAILAFEIGAEGLDERDLDQIKAALETAGVEFTNGREPGVKLKRRIELQSPETE